MVKTKGAIAISFNFFGTSFLFINSHFARKSFLLQRCLYPEIYIYIGSSCWSIDQAFGLPMELEEKIPLCVKFYMEDMLYSSTRHKTLYIHYLIKGTAYT